MIVVDRISSRVVYLTVRKQPGMEAEQLLDDDDDDDADGAAAGGRARTRHRSRRPVDHRRLAEEAAADRVLNIFSVASGHLYERFLRIMMLSVMRNTQLRVKFWLLRNFLSPSFKESIALMARTFGFDYELVTYKWPSWLNPQTNKIRIIWGYKILFLDVLFPLRVRKIIFVDSDQVVRTDLQELADLDLHGAPYGFTPFCDSRPDMYGFAFWRQGYWKQYLGNLPYHISALYVVDLQRFRQIAAGDRCVMRRRRVCVTRCRAIR